MSLLFGTMQGYKKDGSPQQKNHKVAGGTSCIEAVLSNHRANVCLQLLADGSYGIFVGDILVHSGRIPR